MRTLIWGTLLLAILGAPALGLTVAEVIDLHRAGVSEATLRAQIEVTGATYQLTAAQLKALHAAGLKPGFVVWMIRRTKPAARPSEAAPASTAEQLERRIDWLTAELARGRSAWDDDYRLHYPVYGTYGFAPYWGWSSPRYDYPYRTYYRGYRSYGPGLVIRRGNFRFSFGTNFYGWGYRGAGFSLRWRK